MKRISTATKVVDKFGANKPGFTNGNAVAGVPATDLESDWFDHVQEEISRVIEAGGGVVDGSSYTQLLTAIQSLIGSLSIRQYSITALPTADVGPIIVKEVCEVWRWSASAYFTGYRSPLCGRPMDGHTTTPLASEISAVGGTLSKTAYAGLWGYAQENGLVLTQANWTTNIGGHYFVDVDAATFRVPDLRNVFRRYSGTDADTLAARALGSYKADTLKSHVHGLGGNGAWVDASGTYAVNAGGATVNLSRSTLTGAAGTAETAPRHTAFNPVIHI
ncbi:phage tail protein [Herbaspirillum aquaticum]|uniref:Phage tail protein n=1 Tax=Herbaspirillum aquaticum TaxID=568783 RepID=A0A225SRS9_9BURK|nr:phage tail protein [Herbaspirillum aquaticum]OWY32028.1 phage tail protein [Herbaspirillum aquaticum]